MKHASCVLHMGLRGKNHTLDWSFFAWNICMQMELSIHTLILVR